MKIDVWQLVELTHFRMLMGQNLYEVFINIYGNVTGMYVMVFLCINLVYVILLCQSHWQNTCHFVKYVFAGRRDQAYRY